jgi:hypothetical protein
MNAIDLLGPAHWPASLAKVMCTTVSFFVAIRYICAYFSYTQYLIIQNFNHYTLLYIQFLFDNHEYIILKFQNIIVELKNLSSSVIYIFSSINALFGSTWFHINWYLVWVSKNWFLRGKKTGWWCLKAVQLNGGVWTLSTATLRTTLMLWCVNGDVCWKY